MVYYLWSTIFFFVTILVPVLSSNQKLKDTMDTVQIVGYINPIYCMTDAVYTMYGARFWICI